MGIKSLSKLLLGNAPGALKDIKIKNYFNRKIAIDVSMSLYQFFFAIRSDTSNQQLSNSSGQVTSHLSGIFYRTIHLIEQGIKPIYVFDGTPPNLKSNELIKRNEMRMKVRDSLEIAKEKGDKEKIQKLEKRLVKVTKKDCDEVRELLTHMGVPIIDAPGEAEAQCAKMCIDNIVYGTATEDMDALAFGTPILIRHLTQSVQKNKPIIEYNLNSILRNMNLTMKQFIDICILCGCDYTKSINGIGPKRALSLIKKHDCIENVLKKIDTNKFIVPPDFLYKEARELFTKPNVKDLKEYKFEWKFPNEKELINFMVNKKAFGIGRIKSGIDRIKKAMSKKQQTRMDSFFPKKRERQEDEIRSYSSKKKRGKKEVD